MHFVATGGAGGGNRPVKCTLQPCKAEISRCGVAKVAVNQHLTHHPLFQRTLVAVRFVIAHRALRGRFGRKAQTRPKCDFQRMLQGELMGNGVVEHGVAGNQIKLFKQGETHDGGSADLQAPLVKRNTHHDHSHHPNPYWDGRLCRRHGNNNRCGLISAVGNRHRFRH